MARHLQCNDERDDDQYIDVLKHHIVAVKLFEQRNVRRCNTLPQRFVIECHRVKLFVHCNQTTIDLNERIDMPKGNEMILDERIKICSDM